MDQTERARLLSWVLDEVVVHVATSGGRAAILRGTGWA